MEMLAEKIRNNMRGAKKQDGRDYVEKNIDYLERKSVRNSAKTLFTEFLEAHELFMKCCKEGRPDDKRAIEAAAAHLIKILSDLDRDYARVYREDMEIQGLKTKAFDKITDLINFFKEHRPHFEEKGLKTIVETSIQKILDAPKALSSL
jgi:hypothetical protein